MINPRNLVGSIHAARSTADNAEIVRIIGVDSLEREHGFEPFADDGKVFANFEPHSMPTEWCRLSDAVKRYLRWRCVVDR